MVKDYVDYCYSPEDPTTSTPPYNCCWLYPETFFRGNKLELCFREHWTQTHVKYRTETVYHSKMTLKDFDNDAESW